MVRGTKVVTLQDIAEQIGVDKSTVHRALRGDPRVKQTTIAKIKAVADKLGYDPEVNQAARRLSHRRFGRFESPQTVALFFPVVFSRSPYFLRQFHGFMEVMSESGFDVLARIVSDGNCDRLPPAVARGDVDAVVSLAHPAELQQQQLLLNSILPSLRRPFISLINPLPGAWSVTADFVQGGRAAIHHLLELGHRHFLVLDGLSHQHRARLEGMREELVAQGLDPRKHLTAFPPDDTIVAWRERVVDALDRMLAHMPVATAFIAPNDQVAVLVVALLAERGRQVPERMSVIGFDDTDPLLGAEHQNILTTVALPLEQIGREAARMAMEPGAKPRTVVLPISLRVRGTTQRLAAPAT